uniref:G_PROTEIN_RECEP_F1_2 domain-containing protein n=1 Tax=Rhabditophanes sp. KR3021 TaxID=114890 RepID=A0AC35UC30_9BILA
MALQTFLMLYIFPFQLAVGILGNLLNLRVLLSRSMRSKTYNLLAIMALADIFFLLSMTPQALTLSQFKNYFVWMRRFLLHSTYHFAGLANISSFISAWLIILLSVERTSVIAFPLRARNVWTSRTLVTSVCIIFLAGNLLTLHWHITHTVAIVQMNMTTFNESVGQIMTISKKVQIQTIKDGMEQFEAVNKIIEVAFLVLIPVFTVLTVNIILVFNLRKQHSSKKASKIILVTASTFTVCNFPSAAVHIWEMLMPSIGEFPSFRTLATLSNSLIITGKVTNFFLFCLWSVNFKKRFLKIAEKELPCLYSVAKYVNSKKPSLSSYKRSMQTETELLNKSIKKKQKLCSVRTFDENGDMVEKMLR